VHSDILNTSMLCALWLAIIWCSRFIDEAVHRHWYYGNFIDNHTPAPIIAIFGWIGLLACAIFAVAGRSLSTLLLD
jgi:hypothetical protein